MVINRIKRVQQGLSTMKSVKGIEWVTERQDNKVDASVFTKHSLSTVIFISKIRPSMSICRCTRQIGFGGGRI